MLLQRFYRVANCKSLCRIVLRRGNIYRTHKRENNIMQLLKNSLLSPTFAIMSAIGLMKVDESQKKSQIQEIADVADELFNQGEYDSAYALLSTYRHIKDIEILWRLCRVIYYISKTADEVEAQKLIIEGYDLLLLALNIQENHYKVQEWKYIYLQSTVKKDESETSKKEILVRRADDLFKQGEYKSIYELLSNYKDSKDVEILWRLSRAIYNISANANDAEAEQLIREGHEIICTAFNITKSYHHAVHKWMRVFVNSVLRFKAANAHIKEFRSIRRQILHFIGVITQIVTISTLTVAVVTCIPIFSVLSIFLIVVGFYYFYLQSAVELPLSIDDEKAK